MPARAYRTISADSHLEVDSRRWIHRIPEQHRDRAPRLVRLADGADAWVIEGLPAREVPSDLYGGKGRDHWRPYGQRYDETPGTGSPEQRVRELDEDGLDAEVLYPCQVGGPVSWRSITDDEAYKAVVRGYNDWLADEYCAAAPDRLLGLGIIPMTNLDDAIAELGHIKRLGLRGALINAFPSNRGHPVPEDDRFWAASLDLDMPVSIHVQLDRSGPRSGPLFQYPNAAPGAVDTIKSPNFAEQVSRFHRVAGLNAVQLVLSGIFDRFPRFRVYMAETHAGWVPFFYQMADQRYKRHLWWAEEILGYARPRCLPSYYMREHVYWGIMDDRVGVEMRQHIGANRIMWCSDFPHQESDWPHSQEVITRIFAGVPEAERHQMVAGNCVEFFKLDTSEAGRLKAVQPASPGAWPAR